MTCNSELKENLVNGKGLFVLHFDVNGTVVPFDSIKDDDSASMETKMETYRLTTIAKYLKGNEENGVFFPDENGTMTYKQFLQKKLSKPERILASLQVVNTFANNDQVIKMYENLKENNSMLMKSFRALKHGLDFVGANYIIVFQTFGTDNDILKSELTKCITFQDVEIKDKTTKDLEELYNLDAEKQRKEIWFVQADWKIWNANNEQPQFGKLMPIVESHKILTLFFDDNENIVNPRSKDGTFIPVDKLPSNCKIVLVNSYENIVDPNYYINLVFKQFE